MGEHVVARPPASAATVGPAWPPVTARGRCVSWLQTAREHRSPLPLLSRRRLCSFPCPALRHEAPIAFGRAHAAGSAPCCSQPEAEGDGACGLLRVSSQTS